MSLALVVDTETTGLKEPQVIELAERGPIRWIDLTSESHPIRVQRFQPSKDIEPGAMATHHIIPVDLVGKPPSPTEWRPEDPGVRFLIGHKVDSDWEALGRPHGLELIDTYVLARRIWDKEGSHKLSSMMYVLCDPVTAREMTLKAHEAETDVMNCCVLLDACIYELQSQGLTCQSWEDLARITEEFRVPLRMGFSKYGPKNGQPGTLYADVPTGMLNWMLDPCRVADMDKYEVIAAERQLQLRGLR